MPQVERVVGLRFKKPYGSTDRLEIGPPHFVTAGLVQRTAFGEFDSPL
jgi:hypothetical protein